jgi:hypothetical protein
MAFGGQAFLINPNIPGHRAVVARGDVTNIVRDPDVEYS